MKFEFPTLDREQISVKVKQVTAKGAVALLYKSARVDMDMLDAVVGQGNWECDYREIHGNLYCGVGIYDADRNCVVWKLDCGIESGQDDGNEKKAEASDAFKRAGFRWGIGRELYSAPFIFLQVETENSGGKYKLKNPFERFEVASIAYDDNRKIAALTIVDGKGNAVYTYGGKKPVPAGHANEWHVGDEEMTALMKCLTPDQMNKCSKAYGADLRGMSKAAYEKALKANEGQNS